MASRLAKIIRVECERIPNAHGKGTTAVPRLTIDGEEFPYFTVDGYSVTIKRTEMSGVTLTIAAERVEVVDDKISPPSN